MCLFAVTVQVALRNSAIALFQSALAGNIADGTFGRASVMRTAFRMYV
jgi:hypothetical protein